MNPTPKWKKSADTYNLLSRLVLTHESNFWNFHAAWFRFADGSVENLAQGGHKHMLFELHYVLSGQLGIQFPHGEMIHVPRGKFVIIPPQTMHRIFDEAPPSSKLVSGFDVQSENRWVQRCLKTLAKFKSYEESEVLRKLLDTLQYKMEINALDATYLSVFLIQCIILEMFEIVQPPEMYKPDVQLKTSLNDYRIEMVRNLIHGSNRPDVTGGEIAQMLSISLRQLNRICRAQCGCTVHALIQRERIQRASALLETSTLSLTDISEMAGYSSVYSFIRAFKHMTGITPGEYQKNAGKRT